MEQEREQGETEQEQGSPSEEGAFDENPPVEPGEPQVGNSKARFFMPREEEGEEGEGSDAGEGSTEGDQQRSES